MKLTRLVDYKYGKRDLNKSMRKSKDFLSFKKKNLLSL